MKQFLLLLLFVSVLSCKPKGDLAVVESPSGNLKVKVSLNGNRIFYQVIATTDSGETVVLPSSPLGITRSDASFAENLNFKSVSEIKTVSDSYTMVAGKQKDHSYTAREIVATFANGSNQEMQVAFRIFDEGVAFRYIFPGESGSEVSVESEATGFSLPENADAWMAPYQQAKPWGDPGYEAEYMAVKAGTPSPSNVGWAFPLLFNTGKFWVFISETGLDANYCGTHLKQDCAGGLYTISLPEADERQGDGKVQPSSQLPWTMPWRFVLVSPSLTSIAESEMVHHLAQPSTVEDISWIKPGRASWEWWSSKGGRTVKNLKKFVDLAAGMGWEYSLVDAGWEKMSDGTIEEVVEHAKNKNVGLLFWYNSGGRRDSSARNEDFVLFNDDSRNKEMARIAAMGIKGIKVDFFATDKQMAIALYLKILQDAARYKLLVNFHGCTLPRGWSRTYPHLLTMEAVRGAECYRFSKTYPEVAPAYNTMASVTRSVVGPADYTPATFSHQKFPHITTFAHELALTIVYQTGLLHLADTPESYQSLPREAVDFLKNVPVTWDETKVLNAVPGELFVVARRSGTKWYIAGINGKNEQQTIQVKFPVNLSDVVFIGDGEKPDAIKSLIIKENLTDYTVSVAPNGGFVLFQPK